jgi:hypothetical protein
MFFPCLIYCRFGLLCGGIADPQTLGAPRRSGDAPDAAIHCKNPYISGVFAGFTVSFRAKMGTRGAKASIEKMMTSYLLNFKWFELISL